MELSVNSFTEGDAKGNELLLANVWVLFKLTLVLAILNATLLVETGAKQSNFFNVIKFLHFLCFRNV